MLSCVLCISSVINSFVKGAPRREREESQTGIDVGFYSQSFVYCRVFVFLIIDYSTKKGVLVNSRKRASEIVYFRSNPYSAS